MLHSLFHCMAKIVSRSVRKKTYADLLLNCQDPTKYCPSTPHIFNSSLVSFGGNMFKLILMKINEKHISQTRNLLPRSAKNEQVILKLEIWIVYFII